MKFSILICLSLVVIASSQMPGGRRPYDLTNPKQLEKIEKLAKYGVETIAKRRMEAAKKTNGVSSSADTPLSYNHRVLSAESQVVAGANYYIKIKMNDATCSKFCSVEECDLVVWERVWENFQNLTRYNCKVKNEETVNLGAFADRSLGKNSDILVGQAKVVDIDSKALAALDQIITGINSNLNSIYLHKVKAVNEVKKQIVSGILYRFKFQIAKTSCDRREIEKIETCEIVENANALDCEASVLDKVWMRNRYSSIKFECN